MEQSFSNQELKFSYWYITHKLEIRRWMTIALGVVAFLLWLYIIWQMTFFAISFKASDARLKQMVFGENPSLGEVSGAKPQDLQVSDVEVFGEDGGSVEMAAKVRNPNASWAAQFNYQFNSSDSQSQFILPGEEAYIMGLNMRDSAGELKITDLSWQRVANFKELYEDRNNFVVTNEKFTAGIQVGDPNTLSFDIKNNSAYSFWETEVQGFLYDGGSLVALGSIKLQQFKSGEAEHVEMLWNKRLPRITEFQVVPRVNVVLESNIMPPGGGTGEYH